MSEEVTLPPGISKGQAQKLLKEQPVVFSEVEISYLKKLKVWKNFYKGRESYCVQQFYKEDETQEEWLFGKAITLPYEAIDTIIEGLTKMKEYIEGERG
jgi:hypothetical protein